MKIENGSRGFSKEYWVKNYSEPEDMDGIFNAKGHALYLKNFFDLENVEVKSMIDLGHGLGYLLREFYKTFNPQKAWGIEPSEHGFLQSQKLLKSYDIKLENTDLLSWCKKKWRGKKAIDLGICTGVIHYLPEEEIKQILPVLAQRVRYLYFSVPTNKELDRQISEMEFLDPYAKRRSKSKYLNLLKPYFTIVSSRVLESKNFYSDENTKFTDLLFRF
ncbi:MAG: hypothetical protein DRQ88_02185 [Epsilonproteobacteria bacterium]|nr:MAG: hypothetical protein DRQ89_00930 [Campylobacterota bacterium]RLA67671.1 MAG: hypothetical protein DRQ88_02185 [Campylobacterota bacterium]